ncbi:hypothetical protein OG206_01310 [Streptomyces sp. NBC_01341]|uniref:hypothetical protein n=1 Tax=Streptomyces sp. NBC_01341 TaxID=2903831 RepID=UPI002E152AD6|nr:hypothetical protein OG206_01310 [Streptomyces sp. NBC_01341]
MAVIWWAVVVTASCAGWGIWRALRYPGAPAYAFQRKYRSDRKNLAGARELVRGLRSAALRERGRAWLRAERAERAYRRRIVRTEAALRQLRTPKRGRRLEQLGRIVLHEHAVLVGHAEIPLAGLRVRLERARSGKTWYVYLTEPDGHELVERYGAKEYPEDTVRRFGTRLQNASVKAARRLDGRGGAIRKLEAELVRARTDTGPVRAAQAARQEIRLRHENRPELPKARAALEDAKDAWQALTGRRPR